MAESQNEWWRLMVDRSIKTVLNCFPGKRVLVIGDVMLDEYLWGKVQRISPEAPVPVLELCDRTYMPGGAANTAANVAGLEGHALLIGIIGEDQYAQTLIGLLESFGTSSEGLVVDRARSTTTKTRVVAHNQHLVRVDVEDRASPPVALENRLLELVEDLMTAADAVVISDYAKGVVTRRVAQRIIEMARKALKPIVVDPKGKDYSKYNNANVIKPNLLEVEEVLGRPLREEQELVQAGHELVAALAGSDVLITRGPQGMSLFRDRLPPLHLPSLARDVYDVTGAGDTVTATLAIALAAGTPLDQAAWLANIAAGIVVGKVGTATITLDLLHEASWKEDLDRAGPSGEAAIRNL